VIIFLLIWQALSGRQQTCEVKLNEIVNLADKTIPQTGFDGRRKIQDDLQEVQATSANIFKDLKSTKVILEKTKLEWDQYDSLNDQLSRYIRETKQLIKDQELKSTIDEKKIELKQLKVY